MLQVVVFLALAFSIVIAIFAVQNTTPVAVSFLVFRLEAVAVSVLVLVSAALGAGVILLLGAAREVQHRWRNRSLNQQLRSAHARIDQLQATAAPEPVPPPQKALEAGSGADEVASASGSQTQSGVLPPSGPPV
jgi:lipopolysaccharide assembly protein A